MNNNQIDLSTLKAISIRQPWCHNILCDGKDVENRTWRTHFRGTVLIHAAKAPDQFYKEQGLALERGGIVGVMDIIDCFNYVDSIWFNGPWGFVIRNARPVPFIPCRGALSFFKPDIEEGKYFVDKV